MNNNYLAHVSEARKIEYAPGFYLTVPRAISCTNSKVSANGEFPNGDNYLEKTYTWINGTYHDIWVKHRDGTMTFLPPDSSAQGYRTLMCTVRYTNKDRNNIRHESDYLIGDIVSNAPHAYQVSRDAVQQKRDEAPQLYRSTRRTVSLSRHQQPSILNSKSHVLLTHDYTKMFQEYSWTIEEIAGAGGVYLDEMDVVAIVGSDMASGVACHPHGVLKNYINTLNELNKNLTVSMCIIDNDGRIGKYYTTVSGEVYEIPVLKDPMRPDGFYIFKTPAVTDKDHQLKIAKHLKVEEAVSSGIIRTTVDVLTVAAETKLKTVLETHAINEQSRMLDDKMRALQEQMKLITSTREEMNKRYERELIERSSRRKESLDIGKFILSAFSSLVPIFYKLFASK